MTQGDTPADSYVLGTEPEEQERLRLQHELWRPAATAAYVAAARPAGGPGLRDRGTAAPAAAAMARARLDPGADWVGPTVLALRARRGEGP